MFLWLLVYDHVLTNVNKFKRGLCSSGIRAICHEEETLIHVMSDCRLVKGTWLSLGILRIDQHFFSYSWQDLMAFNLKGEMTYHIMSQNSVVKWNAIFVCVVGFFGSGDANSFRSWVLLVL